MRKTLEAKLVAQIDIANGLVTHNRLGIAFGNNMAFADNIGSFTNGEGFANIVVRNKYTDTAVFKVGNNLFDIVN